MANARPGPCAPWCTADDIQTPAVRKAAAELEQKNALEPDRLELICAQSADAASEILYELSGRVFTGECGPVRIRPVSRPTDIDTRSLVGGLSPLGWASSWGAASSYGSAMPGVAVHYGSVEPPTIKLPYPVNAITLVKIDGVTIPAIEYELRDHKDLVRIRPTASYVPTQRYGWPTSQTMDLPDTEQGTFSITFTYGNPPPALGRIAAVKLAEFLALPQLGDTSKYPRRVTQMARQGVTTQVTDVMDLLKSKQLGIYEVDAFLMTVNPSRNQRQAAVWSPDVGRPRRTATPT